MLVALFLLCRPTSPPTKACGRWTTSRVMPFKAKYGAEITDEWLAIWCRSRSPDSTAAAAARSRPPNGLVLTNHHCARGAASAQNSSEPRANLRGRRFPCGEIYE